MSTDERVARAQAIIAKERATDNVIAIDPYGCGCTECITGQYVPLHWATDTQMIAMILGELANNTGYELSTFQVNDDGTVEKPAGSWRE